MVVILTTPLSYWQPLYLTTIPLHSISPSSFKCLFALWYAVLVILLPSFSSICSPVIWQHLSLPYMLYDLYSESNTTSSNVNLSSNNISSHKNTPSFSLSFSIQIKNPIGGRVELHHRQGIIYISFCIDVSTTSLLLFMSTVRKGLTGHIHNNIKKFNLRVSLFTSRSNDPSN